MTQEALNKRFSVLRTTLAIGVGILLSIIIIVFVSDDPLLSIKYLTIGPLLNLNNFYSLVTMWIPLVITGLAVCIMFNANQFNLFAEGAFFFGGVIATATALSLNLPPVIHPIVCILVAAVVSGLGMIPALMRYKLGASEMVASLLLNYACLQLGMFIISYFYRDPDAGSVVSEKLPDSAKLGELIRRSNIHAGLFVAVFLTIVVYYFLFHTRWGFEIRLTGQNGNFARYAGVNIGFVIVFSQILGGALAGGAGAMGTYNRFSWTSLTNHGWDGVTLTILAGKNPKYIPLAALFLAYLRKGADLMSMKTDMQTDFVSVIQAVILIFLLAEQFLAGYRQKKTYELSKKLEECEA